MAEESKAKAESFLLSGWVILSMRSTLSFQSYFPKAGPSEKRPGGISKYLKCSLLISTVKGKNLIKKVKVQFQQTTELEYKNVGQAVSWEKMKSKIRNGI